MNHDDVQWNVMGQGFCSFKVKTRDDKLRFCRSPYNLTGRCSAATCPLSNSQYATAIEHEDEIYLYVKTAERAHLPRRMWEKIKLDASFPKALEQIDEQLQWWDRRMVHKVKARMLRLKQYLMRKKKALQEPETELVSVNKREEFKLVRREAKAEKAARIELEIERELLDRLKAGTYDSVVNANMDAFDKLLDEEEAKYADEEAEEEDEEDEEMDEEFDETREYEMDDGDADALPTYVMDDDEDEGPDDAPKALKKGSGGKRARITIEREEEREAPARTTDLDW